MADALSDDDALALAQEQLAFAMEREFSFFKAPHSEWLKAATGVFAKMGIERVGNLYTMISPPDIRVYLPTFTFRKDVNADLPRSAVVSPTQDEGVQDRT
jgi:hypothetical protein